MPEIIDGHFDDPEGRKKVFVKLRPDESQDEFAARAMAILEGQTFPPDEILQEDE